MILAAYILIGITLCLIVASRKGKTGRRSESPLLMLFDPGWPVILFWPLWLGIVLVERSFPKTPQIPPSTPFDPIGKTGRVVTDLRPTGRIQIGSTHYDARSDGRIIPAGVNVRVVARSMAELIVEEVGRLPSE